MYSPTSELKMYYNMEINCNLCYNRPTVSIHNWDEVPPGIVSSCLKYLSLDIVQTVSWAEISQKDRIFCHRCNENIIQLSRLNIQMEQIKNDIDEIARQINQEVLAERRIYQYNKNQYQNPIYIPEMFLGSETRDHSTLLHEPVHLEVSSKDKDIHRSDILIQNCWSIEDSSMNCSGEKNIASNEAQKNIMEPHPNVSEDVHNLERINDAHEFTSPRNSRTFTGGAILAKYIGENPLIDCEICGMSFRGVGVLKPHQCQTHEGNKPFKCEICGMAFGFKTNYTEHLKTHSEEKTNDYECETCGEKISDLPGFLQHMKTHYKPKRYQCKICNLRFAEKEILDYHSKDHITNNNQYTCHVCISTFETIESLLEHLKTHPKEKHNYTCDECEKSYTSEKNVKKHELTHYKSKSVQCTQCDKQFYTIDGLKSHVSTIHSNSEVINITIKCEVCGISCIDRPDYKQHMKTHHSMKCEKCEEAFDNHNSWIVHTQTKLCKSKTTFHCEECPSKTFSSVKSLKQHQTNHLQLRRRKSSTSKSCCTVCDQSFSKKNHLIKHQVTEHHVTAGSSFSCEQCQGIFENVGFYHWHKVTANNPIVCKVCTTSNTSFKCWCDCYVHINAVHNNLDENHPHQCKNCRFTIPPRYTKTHVSKCIHQKSDQKSGEETQGSTVPSVSLKRTLVDKEGEPSCKKKKIITSTRCPFTPGQEKLYEKLFFDWQSSENETSVNQNENNISVEQMETLEMNEEIEYPVENFVNVETKIEIKEGCRGLVVSGRNNS